MIEYPEIRDMVGLVFSAVTANEDEMTFTLLNGGEYVFYHEQDCCEYVSIDDINGDLNDLVGVPLLVAEERKGDYAGDSDYESATWTFYTFRTIKGSVDVRWLGTSNGYYSESVHLKYLE